MLAPLIAAGVSAAANLIGSRQAAKAQEENAQRNIALQKEFAQSGIQWRVEDAKKAGVHPLFAMGASTTSFSPVQVGDGGGGGIAAAGQNIGRAIEASASPASKVSSLAATLAAAQIRGVELDNEIKKQRLLSDIALKSQPATPPGVPEATARSSPPGQGNIPAVGKLDFKRDVAPGSVGAPVVEAGENPEVSLYRSGHDPASGGYGDRYAPQIPQQLSEAFEQDWLSYYQWIYRNKILPAFGQNMSPPPWVKLEPNEYWKYNLWRGEYEKRRYHDETKRFSR